MLTYFEEPVEFSPHVLTNKNVRILPDRGGDFRGAFELVKAGTVKEEQVITHVFPLDTPLRLCHIPACKKQF